MNRSILLVAVMVSIAGSVLAGSIGWVCASAVPPETAGSSAVAEDPGSVAYRHGHLGRTSTLHFLLRDSSLPVR